MNIENIRNQEKVENINIPNIEISQEEFYSIFELNNKKIINYFKTLSTNIDEETLRFFSIIKQREGLGKEDFFKYILYNKNFESIKSIEDLYSIFSDYIESLRENLNSKDLELLEKNKKKHLNHKKFIENYKNRLSEILNFFKFKNIPKNIIIGFTDGLFDENDKRVNNGQGMIISDDEGVIITRKESEINQEHEFLHFCINPITDKIKLSKKQEEFILQNSPNSLIENYGNHPKSILNELFIRLYTQVFKRNLKEVLSSKINSLSQKEFEELINNPKLNKIIQNLNINNLKDLKENINNFYISYIKDKYGYIGIKLLDLFEIYKNKNDVSFEYFLNENLDEVLN